MSEGATIILLRTPLVQWLLAGGPDGVEVDRWDDLPDEDQRRVLRSVRRMGFMDRAGRFTAAGTRAVDSVVAASEMEIEV